MSKRARTDSNVCDTSTATTPEDRVLELEKEKHKLVQQLQACKLELDARSQELEGYRTRFGRLDSDMIVVDKVMKKKGTPEFDQDEDDNAIRVITTYFHPNTGRSTTSEERYGAELQSNAIPDGTLHLTKIQSHLTYATSLHAPKGATIGAM